MRSKNRGAIEAAAPGTIYRAPKRARGFLVDSLGEDLGRGRAGLGGLLLLGRG
jgi:hypothetical protein